MPNRERMIVPRYKSRRQEEGLPMLGEEDSPTLDPLVPLTNSSWNSTASSKTIPGALTAWKEEVTNLGHMANNQHSFSTPVQTASSARTDIIVASAARNAYEEDDARDGSHSDEFIPPHVWSRKTVGELEMLGTSVHDHE